ncbi:TIGR03089 family protein [Arthrobacter cryoconiti]|uniref:TIGR03089 family protein n=1 Tax=Arthrobacter cryoconiti TaxID=748907 RepID=A0ABV8R3W1_9MICC|nr:TIGR03089 family protein [Arthrobacter cryoconiti]MCC9066977.1 TIGR03089 family protein [Arthrobacter cryoconiti]
MTTSLRTIAALLQAFRLQNPTAPRLTWYGADSERVELSGRVLDNWVAKTANFLIEELDAEAGTVVALDLPIHWRSIVWTLASFATGGTVMTGQSDADETGYLGSCISSLTRANIVATANPVDVAQQCVVLAMNPCIVAVALPALAMRWTGDLPSDAVDYSGGVRAHADVFFADEAPDAGDTAWEHSVAGSAQTPEPGGLAVSFAQLFGPPTVETLDESIVGQRLLLEARDGWAKVLPAALRTWAAGGSVVLLDPSVTATDHLRSTENVTAG